MKRKKMVEQIVSEMIAMNAGPISRPIDEMEARVSEIIDGATRQPAQIMGRMIGYIIAASLLVLASGGLVWAIKMAARMVTV